MEDNSHMFEDESNNTSSVRDQWKSMPKGMPGNTGAFSAQVDDNTQPVNPDASHGVYTQNRPDMMDSYRQAQQNTSGVYQQNQPNTSGAYQQNQQNMNGAYQYGQQIPYPQYTQAKRDRSSLGTAALILGAISLAFFLTYFNIITAVIAIVMGITCITSPSRKKALAVAGIVTAILSIVLTIGSTVLIGQRIGKSFKDFNNGIYFGQDYKFNDPDDIQDFLDNYMKDDVGDTI